jgi:hypothetical protein
MDSPAFTLCLLVIVPMLAATWHALNRPRTPVGEAPAKRRFQFSIAKLLTAVLAIALVLAISRWTITGVYSLIMVSALTMMGAEICYAKAGRMWPAAMMTAALIYAALNYQVYFGEFPGASNIEVFSRSFVLTSLILGPLGMIGAAVASVVLRSKARANPPWVGLAGFILWMLGVAVANAYVLAMIAASV